MNFNKIDKALLSLALSLEEGKKWECIVRSYDYQRTKNSMIHKNIKILNEYLFINSFRVLADRHQLEQLSNMSQVKFVSSVSKASTLMHVAKKILGVEEQNLSGSGVAIAFIDTGIEKHCDFCLGGNRIIEFKDFVNERENCYDDNGHGTFVTGVCCGNGALSCGRNSGIAPKANIVSLKALNKHGEASADKILDAMEWVYNNHQQYDIKVVCMSFGSEPLGFNDPIMLGAEALWRAGVIVVAAAGNSGPEFQTIKSPGVSNQIITVGGFNDNRLEEEEVNENFFEIAEFSSRGPAFQRFKPDLVAPSVDILSCGLKNSYCKLSGTSVATPMIAGLCALLIEQNPKITPMEIKRILLSCCKPITFNRNLEGLGYPNLNNIKNRNRF